MIITFLKLIILAILLKILLVVIDVIYNDED